MAHEGQRCARDQAQRAFESMKGLLLISNAHQVRKHERQLLKAGSQRYRIQQLVDLKGGQSVRNAEIKPVVLVNQSHGSPKWHQIATAQAMGPSATDSTVDGGTYQTPCLVFKKQATLLRNGASHKTQLGRKPSNKMRNNTLNA